MEWCGCPIPSGGGGRMQVLVGVPHPLWGWGTGFSYCQSCPLVGVPHPLRGWGTDAGAGGGAPSPLGVGDWVLLLPELSPGVGAPSPPGVGDGCRCWWVPHPLWGWGTDADTPDILPASVRRTSVPHPWKGRGTRASDRAGGCSRWKVRYLRLMFDFSGFTWPFDHRRRGPTGFECGGISGHWMILGPMQGTKKRKKTGEKA